MVPKMKRLIYSLSLLLLTGSALFAQPKPDSDLPSISKKIQAFQKFPGFFPFYWDEKAGKIWLEIDKWHREFLYVESLPTGIGSNDIGLDRGQLGRSYVVRFERTGPRVLLIAKNYGFRSHAEDPSERIAVREAFAESTLWGFEVAAEEDDRVLVDATSFYLRDVYQVAATLQRLQQGNFRLDPTRSAFYLPNTKNYPKNTEVETTLTFTAEGEVGAQVRSVTPMPQAITVREHVSFVELPTGSGFRGRHNDPRAGYFGIQYMEFSNSVESPVVHRRIIRHPLEKKDPSAAISEPVKPIVYYVDRGAPHDVRRAIMEGARWWNQAFEAAGYRNAIRVEEGFVDPMDVHHHVIQYVHRSTRGWSYGSTLVDPRTGEIIQARVSIGSLRDRQDYLIAEGLLAPHGRDEAAQIHKIKESIVLARLRQLAAHEVGHTLGLQHNFAASITGRASVMDYPAPYVKLGADGLPDISNAYATGIGEWDKVAIAYGYQEFSNNPFDDNDAREKLLRDAFKRGLRYLTDQDARPAGASSSVAHLWDNGSNAIDELANVMQVRAVALSRFGENNIRERLPMAMLEDVLVPLYMYHRYQVEAAAKVIGGEDYTFGIRGQGDRAPEIVAPHEQRRALVAVLDTLKPDALALPSSVLRQIPPRPPGYPRTRENFRVRTSPTFDALAPAEAYTNHVCDFLFNPERAERLVQHHARSSLNPSLTDVIDTILERTWKAPMRSTYHGEIQRTVNMVILHELMALAANERASNQVRAIAELKLEELRIWVAAQRAPVNDSGQKAYLLYAANQIKRFQDDPKKMNLTKPNDPPDGQPIGMDWWMKAEREWCGWQ
jgi:Met-zincin/Domain of unknown function (DUF5117)